MDSFSKKRTYSGGFVPDPLSRNGMDDSPYIRKGSITGQTLRPVTIKQILNSTQDTSEPVCKIDNVEINQLQIIGCIRGINSHPSYISYMVEDGTEMIECKLWIDNSISSNDSQEDEEQSERERLLEKTWVCIIGNLRLFSGRKLINIYSIKPLIDYDQFIFHMALCIQVHYYYTKGTGLIGNDHNMPLLAGSGNFNQYDRVDDIDNELDLTREQQTVMNLFNKCKNNEGLNIDTACKQLKDSLGESKTRGIIEWLIDEGHLYSTIDNNHAKSTSG